MSDLLRNVLDWCKNNKKIFVFSFVCFVVFTFLIFPFDDLTGYVSDQVYKGSNSRVTLMASGMSLSVYPPGIKLSGDDETPLTIDSLDFPPNMPALELESVALAPSITSLLQFKAGFFAKMNGLFGGDASLRYRQGDKVSDKSEVRQHVVGINADEIGADQLANFLSLPFKIKGQVGMDVDATIDPEFRGQPESEFEINLDDLRIVGFNYIGMSIPTLDIKTAKIKGVLKDGELQLEQIQLGKKGDDIFGTINGQMKLRLVKVGNTIAPQFSSYRLNLDLTTASKLDKLLGFLDLVLPDIKKYKTRAAGGSRYNMALTGSSFRDTPRLSRPRR